jgi:hypothetical protein
MSSGEVFEQHGARDAEKVDSDDGSDVEGFYDAIPEHTLTYKTCRDAMSDNGALLLEIDENKKTIARLTEGKLALTAEYDVIHKRQYSDTLLMKKLLHLKRISTSPKDQLQVVIECFLSMNVEMNMDTHHRSSFKHLFAEFFAESGPHPRVRMYPYMIFEVRGVKHAIVSAVNKKDIRVWYFKPDQYKEAMKTAMLARVDPADIRNKISFLRSKNPYKWNDDQPYHSARVKAREMLGWTEPINIEYRRDQGRVAPFADVAEMVVNALNVRNILGWSPDNMMVTDIEPLGKRLYREEDEFEWKDGDFEYTEESESLHLN